MVYPCIITQRITLSFPMVAHQIIFLPPVDQQAPYVGLCNHHFPRFTIIVFAL